MIKINIEEGVKFAQDICHGMAYLHSLEPLISGFDLNPHHVFVRNIEATQVSFVTSSLSLSFFSLDWGGFDS